MWRYEKTLWDRFLARLFQGESPQAGQETDSLAMSCLKGTKCRVSPIGHAKKGGAEEKCTLRQDAALHSSGRSTGCKYGCGSGVVTCRSGAILQTGQRAGRRRRPGLLRQAHRGAACWLWRLHFTFAPLCPTHDHGKDRDVTTRPQPVQT